MGTPCDSFLLAPLAERSSSVADSCLEVDRRYARVLGFSSHPGSVLLSLGSPPRGT